jgi:formylmethanofuran dehydrogenase subunit C
MIRLTLRARPPVRLSLRGLIPERLAGLSADAIARLPLRRGNRGGELGDCFAVDKSGEAEDRLVIAAEGDRLDDVGAEMTCGELVVEGDVGGRAGLEMRGGLIIVQGSAGFGAATAMKGGALRIAGDAGDSMGGALPGEREGMRGGTVVIEGNAGASVGDRMRLGLIAIAGSVGPFCAARMNAGTIVIGGEVGPGAGAAMRRGTLVAPQANLSALPGFADSGVHDVTALRLIARALIRHQLTEVASRLSGLRHWQGDAAVGGKGEIWSQP